MPAPEPIQSYQPQSTFSTWIGVILLFAFFGLLAMVVLQAAPRGDSFEAKRAKARADKLEAAQKQSLTALTTYGWVDKAKGVARIPVTEAMKLTVAELADKKPAAANPIATPEPAAAPATSPGASPAASPAAGASATPAGSPSPAPAATATPATSPKPSSVTGPDSEIRAQPAAGANPPNAAPATQPGASSTPASSPSSAAVTAPASPSPSPSPSAPGTPLPVRGKTP